MTWPQIALIAIAAWVVLSIVAAALFVWVIRRWPPR